MSESKQGGVLAPRDPSAPDVPSPDRRFAADEIDAILRRAAQAEQSAHVPAKHDLTVTELMEVAREVGLDPLAVRKSASIERVGRGGALAATPRCPRSTRSARDHARGPAQRPPGLCPRGGQGSRPLRRHSGGRARALRMARKSRRGAHDRDGVRRGSRATSRSWPTARVTTWSTGFSGCSVRSV